MTHLSKEAAVSPRDRSVGTGCPSLSSLGNMDEADISQWWQFPSGVGLLPAAHQQYAYLQLAGNVSCHVDEKHVNCVAAKMSKKIKIFFFPVVNPAPCLALLSIPGGLGGWMVFFFPFYFCYLPFLSYILCMSSQLQRKIRKPWLKILRWLLYIHICVLIRLSGEKKREGFSFLMPVAFPAAVVDKFLKVSWQLRPSSFPCLLRSGCAAEALLPAAMRPHQLPVGSEQLLCTTSAEPFHLYSSLN